MQRAHPMVARFMIFGREPALEFGVAGNGLPRRPKIPCYAMDSLAKRRRELSRREVVDQGAAEVEQQDRLTHRHDYANVADMPSVYGLSDRLAWVSAASAVDDIFCSLSNELIEILVFNYLSIAMSVADPLDTRRDH